MRTIFAAALVLGVVAVASADGPRRDDGRRHGDHRRSDAHGRWQPYGARHEWHRPDHRWSVGYSYGPVGWYSGGWGWDDGWYASSYEAPVPVWGVSAPVGSASYAANGALLGGIAGAIIGHQDGHAGRGALIGTGAGLLLGAIADSTQRRSEAVPPYQAPPRVYAPAPVSVVPPGPAPAEADYSAPALQPQATRPASRMAEANALFGR